MKLAPPQRVYYPIGMDMVLFGYGLVSVIHICARSEHWKWLGNVSKVLLMPILIFYVLTGSSQPWIIAALACSTIGDAFLAAEERGNNLRWGLVSFFVAHLCYSTQAVTKGFDLRLLAIGIAVASLPFIFVAKTLSGHPGSKRYIAYAANLSILFALCTGHGSMFAIAGSLLFILSDLTIAMGLIGRHRYAATTTMATYIFAQLLLVLGLQ